MPDWLWDLLWAWNIIGLWLIFVVMGLLIQIVALVYRKDK